MIRLEGIFKSYGATKVLEGIGFEVKDGRTLCLMGRSGCGKSTILKLMALITRVDRGNLFIDKMNVAKLSDAGMEETRREKIAYTFQEPLLLPYLTALENITLTTGISKSKVAALLVDLGLGDRLNHHPGKLSEGEKKRVDIARAVLKGAPIVIADEPLSNLDPDVGVKVMGLLKGNAERGGVAVYSSVEPSEAKFADDIVRMDKLGPEV